MDGTQHVDEHANGFHFKLYRVDNYPNKLVQDTTQKNLSCSIS